MGLEYAAGSALGDLRASAAPASLQTVSLSRGVEDDASFASLAARQALAAGPAYAVVLAAELVGAVRAVRLRGLAQPDAGWGAVVRACADLPGAARRARGPRPDPRPGDGGRPAPRPRPTCQPQRSDNRGRTG